MPPQPSVRWGKGYKYKALKCSLSSGRSQHISCAGPVQLIDIVPCSICPVLDWMQWVRIVVDVARGLEYLHKKSQVIHRDIGSSNLLLFDDFKAKIADPDLAATFGYHTPEYASDVRSVQWRKESDVYSSEVVLVELLTWRNPYDHIMHFEQFAVIATLCYHIEPESRPKMNMVVKALQALLKPPAPDIVSQI